MLRRHTASSMIRCIRRFALPLLLAPALFGCISESSAGPSQAPPATAGHVGVHRCGAAHICWDVEDLAAVYEELKGRVRFVTEPKWRTRSDGSTVGLVYGQDPEGNWLEFTQRP